MSERDHTDADVAVIGGGLVGLCSALYLQRQGRRVMVIDRKGPGSEASSHNAGIFALSNCVPTATPGLVRSLPKMLTDPYGPLAIRWRYIPRMAPWLLRFLMATRRSRVEAGSIAMFSLLRSARDAYEELIPIDDDSTRVLSPGGHVLGYETDDVFAEQAFDLEVRRRRGAHLRILDAAALAELAPVLAGRFRHAVHIPDAWFTDPRELTAEVVRRFVAGRGLLVKAEVTGFGKSGDLVTSIRTTGGELGAPAIVIAAGAWSRSLVKRLGFDVPLDTERGYGVDIPDPGIELPFSVISMGYHFGLTPTRTGLRLAGTDELAGLAAPPNYGRADRLIEASKLIFPELNTEGAERWMSFRPSFPDSLPVIAKSPKQANVYLAFGHGHIGLTLAAITGKLVGELVAGETPTVDLEPFSPTRFKMRIRR